MFNDVLSLGGGGGVPSRPELLTSAPRMTDVPDRRWIIDLFISLACATYATRLTRG